MRADMGNAADFWQMQTFDGPGPETINSRLAMVSTASHNVAAACCVFGLLTVAHERLCLTTKRCMLPHADWFDQ
jgi:hypothetical protein